MGQPDSDWSEPATVTDVGSGVWDANALVVGSSDTTRTAAISTERSRFVRIDGPPLIPSHDLEEQAYDWRIGSVMPDRNCDIPP